MMFHSLYDGILTTSGVLFSSNLVMFLLCWIETQGIWSGWNHEMFKPASLVRFVYLGLRREIRTPNNGVYILAPL